MPRGLSVMRITTLLILGWGGTIEPARAENWPEFRGPTGQGHAQTRDLPVKWSATENVRWKTAIPGVGWSSPIVLGGKIYLTTAVPEEDKQSLRVVCLDAAKGEIVWNREVFSHATVRIHKKNSHASPTPITDGKKLWVHFGTHGTAALDLQGNILWQNRDQQYNPVHGNGGSPVLVDGLLVFSVDGSDYRYIVALDQEKGTTVWKQDRPGNATKKFSFGTPLVIEVAGKKQIISTGSDNVTALDPKTGDVVWFAAYKGYSVVPRPVFGNGLLYISSGYDAPSVIAIRPDGKGDVTESHVEWQIKKGAPHNPSPLLINDQLYLISDGGVATALVAKTGEEVWQKRLGGNYSASPLYADGKVYILSETGECIVIRPGVEYEELARNALDERALASIAISEKNLLIRTEQHLYCIQNAPAK